MSSADGAKGLCPLDARNFFEKKLSKSFIPPAGGDEGFRCTDEVASCADQPAKREGRLVGQRERLRIRREV